MAVKVTLTPFLSLGTGLERVIKVLSLICWALGGIIYMYNSIEAIIWGSIYPMPNYILISILLMHCAVRLLSMWMPLVLLLVHWKIKDPVPFIIYIIVTALAPIFAIAAVIVIVVNWDDSDNNTALREDYIKMVKYELDSNTFPSHMLSAVDLYGCCSWNSPTDFFTLFPKRDSWLNNIDFMADLGKCYGNIFEVEGSNNAVKFKSAVSNDSISIITGCEPVFTESAERICLYVVYMAITVFIFSITFIALYIIARKKMDSRVSPARPINYDQQPSTAAIDSEQKYEELKPVLSGESVEAVQMDKIMEAA